MTLTQTTSRTVQRIVPGLRTLEGGGVEITRAFPIPGMSEVDPFLLLDHMGPIEVIPGKAPGFPDHPHRGFETVTYLLHGQMQHRDSTGNRGLLNPGDVQWMTAGAGLVHSEMPGPDLLREGGRLEGFQLWVNLPKRDKMIAPRYQELKSAEVPQAEAAGVKARIIAGESLGTAARVNTHTPITYVHLTLEPGAQYEHAIPRSQNAFVYVIEGETNFGAHAGQMAIFAKDGDSVALANPAGARGPLSLLLLAGEPIHEPVARYGPFVMNTREELHQAVDDYQNGRMGTL